MIIPGAAAALRAEVVVKCLLQIVHTAVATEAIDRLHMATLHLQRKRSTGQAWPAVDQHGALNVIRHRIPASCQ